MADTYGEMFAKQRFVFVLMSGFALLALALTAAGIFFGVLSQAAADVMKLVVSRGMLLTVTAVIAGGGAAMALVKPDLKVWPTSAAATGGARRGSGGCGRASRAGP